MSSVRGGMVKALRDHFYYYTPLPPVDVEGGTVAHSSGAVVSVHPVFSVSPAWVREVHSPRGGYFAMQ